MRRLLAFWFCFCHFFAAAQTDKNTILGLTQNIYTDSLPPSPTCTYLVAGDITLQGNFDLRGITFLLKSDFRRDKTLKHRVFGANIRLCNARVNIENGTFASADSGMWGGIYLADSSSQIRFSESKLQDSYHGIVQTDNSQIVAKNSEFRNNYVSLQLAGNRDTVQHCVFTSKPSRMKMPFDSVAGNDYYYSWAHIKNAEKKELFFGEKQFFLNLFLNGVYGVYANQKHRLQLSESYFYWHKIAAIFHQNGDLRLRNLSEIHLPMLVENTIQMQQERAARGLTGTNNGQVATYGIYAAGPCNDVIADETNIRSTANIPTADGITLPFNHIGYHGEQGVNVTFQYQNYLNAGAGHPNGISKMRIGLSLLDHGNASVVATGLVNNQVAILTERTTAGLINLQMNCNEFVRSSDTMQNVPCVGLQIKGQGSTMNQLGSCPDPVDPGSSQNRPSGNEVMNFLGLGSNMDSSGMFTDVPNPNFFKFIENNTGNPLTYYRYENENVGLVPSTGVDVDKCPGDPIIADVNSCFSPIGIQNRTANPNAITSLPMIQEKVAVLLQNTPNPTNETGTVIGYELPEGTRDAILVVRNYLGVEVHKQSLATNENSVSLLTGDWKAGLYSYSLVVDGRLVKTLKMVVGQ